MTGFTVGGNLPVFCSRNRTQMGTTRDRNHDIPANLTMLAGNWIVKKIQHLSHGKPGLMKTPDGKPLRQCNLGGDFREIRKYNAHRSEAKRPEEGSAISTGMPHARQSTWSRLVHPRRSPPPPAKPRDAAAPDDIKLAPATLSPRDAAVRARVALQALVDRRHDPGERSISTHRAAFQMAMAGLAARS